MKDPLQLSFLSVCAAILSGTAFLTPLVVEAQRGSDSAALASAAALPDAATFQGSEFPIFITPAAADIARTVLRLAQTRTARASSTCASGCRSCRA